MSKSGKVLKPVFHWYGSKCNLAPWIISHFPAHTTYVEVFGGSAAVLLRKEPSPVEVYNDIDSGLVNFFRVLRNEDQAAQLNSLLNTTLYAREEYYDARAAWRDEPEPVRRAYLWYLVASMSFSGNFGSSWSYGVSISCRNMGQAVSSWLGKVERIADVSQRLRSVQVDHRPWQDILKAYDTPNTLFYLDPPYALATRRTADGYEHDFADVEHRELVEAILRLRGKVVLSGYQTDLYQDLIAAGWQSHEKNTVSLGVAKTRAAGKGDGVLKDQRRTEVLWCSHPAA